MERLALEGRPREAVGKEAARRLRRTGLVPGVVYGRGMTARPVTVDAKALRGALHTHAGLNVLIDLGIRADGQDEGHVVMVKDLQRDIFTHDIVHVDFQAISLEETIGAHVPLLITGTAKGVVEGGVLEQHLREVLVECLPTHIPEHLEVDVTELTIGHGVHAGDLTIPEGVTLLTPAEEVVLTIVPPRVVVEEAPPAAPAAEAPEAVPGAPAAPPEQPKPEAPQ